MAEKIIDLVEELYSEEGVAIDLREFHEYLKDRVRPDRRVYIEVPYKEGRIAKVPIREFEEFIRQVQEIAAKRVAEIRKKLTKAEAGL